MSETNIKEHMAIIRKVLDTPKATDADMKIIALAALAMLECLLIDINKVAEAATFLALELQRENSA